MFGFGNNSKEPLADAKSAERWFASFPGNDPLAVHGELLGELGRLGERAARRSPAQLEAVFPIGSNGVGAAAGSLRPRRPSAAGCSGWCGWA